MEKNHLVSGLLVLMSAHLSGCFLGGTVNNAEGVPNVISGSYADGVFTLNGENLQSVNKVRVITSSGNVLGDLSVSSQSESQVLAKVVSAFALTAGSVYSILVSNANADSTITISVQASAYVPLAGGNMTGNLTLGTGKVGIGTTSPSYLLDINGGSSGPTTERVTNSATTYGPELRLVSTGASGQDWRLISNQASNTGGAGNFSIYNATANSDFLVVLPSGNVGIGTPVPGSIFDVNGPNGVYTNTEGSATNSFQIETGKASGDQILYFGNDKTNHNSYIQAVNYSTMVDNLLLNARGGNVGIGSSTPGSNLDVTGPNGSCSNTEFSITNSFQIETGKAAGDQILYFGNDKTNHASYIQAVNYSTTLDALFLNARGGNVGIGSTTVPDEPLTVSGIVDINGGGAVPGSGPTGIGIGYFSANYGWIQSYNSKPLLLNPAGNFVGIGSTATPLYPLVVSGFTVDSIPGTFGSYWNGSTSVSHAAASPAVSILASNDIVAPGFDATSDRRLKDHIEDVSEDQALALIKKIRPVHFRWKESGLFNFGFIAQDFIRLKLDEMVTPVVEKDNPLLKKTVDSDGLTSPEGVKLTINYNQMTAILARALKSLISHFEATDSDIAQLKSDIATLKANNAQLQKENVAIKAQIEKMLQSK